jgi:hypothetical protein
MIWTVWWRWPWKQVVLTPVRGDHPCVGGNCGVHLQCGNIDAECFAARTARFTVKSSCS